MKGEDNHSGEIGRQIFESCWRNLNVKIADDHPAYHRAEMFPRDDRVLIRQPTNELTNRAQRAAYLYKDYARNLDVMFEVRSQMVSGSTDEKLINIVEMLGESPYAECCVVLFGNGFRPTIRRAAEKKAQELTSGNKRIKFITAVGDVLQRKLAHLIARGEFPG